MGFVDFYQHLTQDFLHVTKPLHQLTKKGEEWQWTKSKEGAFKYLKCLIMSMPIPMQPDQNEQFWLETDASGYATP